MMQYFQVYFQCLLICVLLQISFAFNATDCPVCFRIIKACKPSLYPATVVKKRTNIDLLKKFCSHSKTLYVEEAKFCYDMDSFHHELSRLFSMKADENRICKKVFGLNPNFCPTSPAASGLSVIGSTFKPSEGSNVDSDTLYKVEYETTVNITVDNLSSNNSCDNMTLSSGGNDGSINLVNVTVEENNESNVTGVGTEQPHASSSGNATTDRAVDDSGLFLPQNGEDYMCVFRPRHPRVFNPYYEYYECSIMEAAIYSSRSGEVFKRDSSSIKKKKREVFNPDVVYI